MCVCVSSVCMYVTFSIIQINTKSVLIFGNLDSPTCQIMMGLFHTDSFEDKLLFCYLVVTHWISNNTNVFNIFE